MVGQHESSDKPITIRVLEVGRQRMGRSIFRQVPFGDPFGPNFEFQKDEILGFVRSRGERDLLFCEGGVLFKHPITAMLSFAYGETLWSVDSVCLSKGIYTKGVDEAGVLEGHNSIYDCYSAADVAEIRRLQSCAREFFDFIKDKQIYI